MHYVCRRGPNGTYYCSTILGRLPYIELLDISNLREPVGDRSQHKDLQHSVFYCTSTYLLQMRHFEGQYIFALQERMFLLPDEPLENWSLQVSTSTSSARWVHRDKLQEAAMSHWDEREDPWHAIASTASAQMDSELESRLQRLESRLARLQVKLDALIAKLEPAVATDALASNAVATDANRGVQSVLVRLVASSISTHAALQYPAPVPPAQPAPPPPPLAPLPSAFIQPIGAECLLHNGRCRTCVEHNGSSIMLGAAHKCQDMGQFFSWFEFRVVDRLLLASVSDDPPLRLCALHQWKLMKQQMMEEWHMLIICISGDGNTLDSLDEVLLHMECTQCCECFMIRWVSSIFGIDDGISIILAMAKFLGTGVMEC